MTWGANPTQGAFASGARGGCPPFAPQPLSVPCGWDVRRTRDHILQAQTGSAPLTELDPATAAANPPRYRPLMQETLAPRAEAQNVEIVGVPVPSHYLAVHARVWATISDPLAAQDVAVSLFLGAGQYGERMQPQQLVPWEIPLGGTAVATARTVSVRATILATAWSDPVGPRPIRTPLHAYASLEVFCVAESALEEYLAAQREGGC